MLACRSVWVKQRVIQVSTYHSHSRQSERQNIIDRTHTWQQCLVTISEDIQINTTSISNRLHCYVDQIAPITTRIQLPSDHRKWSPCLLFTNLTSDSYARKITRHGENVDPNYDAYRRQKSSIKSCFGHKYVCVYEVRCRIVALKSIFCPILRRPRLEMKRYGIP